MADLKLFRTGGPVEELAPTSVSLERELQTLIEQNMLTFFGVSFLSSEYIITNGRMDSIGLDENYCPVIFEYKRSVNENVINQGLFYLDWLLDHKANFQLLVLEKLGKEAADRIDWSAPCVICIANDFTRFDEHAVNQMQRNIKLVRYKKYDGLILFEHLNVPVSKPIPSEGSSTGKSGGSEKDFIAQLSTTSQMLRDLYATIRDYILSLGDDITENQLKFYVAFKKVKNIACVEVYQKNILIHLRLNPDTVPLESGFTRDMRGIGHYGTGDLQVNLHTMADFEKAKQLLDLAYLNN